MVAWRYPAVNCFSSGVRFDGGTLAFAGGRVAAPRSAKTSLGGPSSKFTRAPPISNTELAHYRGWPHNEAGPSGDV